MKKSGENKKKMKLKRDSHNKFTFGIETFRSIYKIALELNFKTLTNWKSHID